MAAKNYYDILRIPTGADIGEIKSAFRSLAKKCHPDISQNCADDFRLLKEAFDILSDPAKRKSYDREIGLAREMNNSYASRRVNVPPAARDVYDDLVDVLADRFNLPHRKKLEFELYLSRDEFAHGAQTAINIPQEKICPACFGFGGTVLSVCSHCGGSGLVGYEVTFDLSLTPPLYPGQVYELKRGGYLLRFKLKRGYQ